MIVNDSDGDDKFSSGNTFSSCHKHCVPCAYVHTYLCTCILTFYVGGEGSERDGDDRCQM